jgi:hypothetical protein
MSIISAIFFELLLYLFSFITLLVIFIPTFLFSRKNLRIDNRIASENLVYLLLIYILFYTVRIKISWSMEIIISLFCLMDILLLTSKSRRKILIDNLLSYKQNLNKNILWILTVLFTVQFLNIINFSVDSNNHLNKVLKLKLIAQTYDGYPDAWHVLFKFESNMFTLILFDKLVFWLGIYIFIQILIGLSVINKIQIIFLILWPLSYILKWTTSAWPTQIWVLFIYLFLIYSNFATKNKIKRKEFFIILIINISLVMIVPALLFILNLSLVIVILSYSNHNFHLKMTNLFRVGISFVLTGTFTFLLYFFMSAFDLKNFNNKYSVPVSGGIDYGDGSVYTKGFINTLFNYLTTKKIISIFNSEFIFYSLFILFILTTIVVINKSKDFNRVILIFLVVALFSILTGIGEPSVIRGRFLYIVLFIFLILMINLNSKIIIPKYNYLTVIPIIFLSSLMYMFQNLNYSNLYTIWIIRSSAINGLYSKLQEGKPLYTYNMDVNYLDRLSLFQDICQGNFNNAKICYNDSDLFQNYNHWSTNFFKEKK